MRNWAVEQYMVRAFLCFTLAGKTSTASNSANLTASYQLQQ